MLVEVIRSCRIRKTTVTTTTTTMSEKFDTNL